MSSSRIRASGTVIMNNSRLATTNAPAAGCGRATDHRQHSTDRGDSDNPDRHDVGRTAQLGSEDDRSEDSEG
jgi:hypothetical protein